MAEDVNISYSFQTGPAATPAPEATPADNALIAFTNCEQVDLGNGGVLLLNRDNGKQMTISPEVATALTYCDAFKTLQEHAQTLINTIPQLQGQLENVTTVLTMVKDAGLMLDAQSICERLSPDPLPAAELAPTRICIITCDRPTAVERLLDSMLQAGNLSRHDEILLVDDSRNPVNGEQNRELVTKFNLRSAKNMRYVGAAEQHSLLLQLIAARPEHAEAIRFLIDRERWAQHQSYGLARTLCLLLSVGYRCIVLDDDVLCASVLPPNQDKGITFGGGSNRELACYTSEQELFQNARFSDTDPLRGHAWCLGMNLSQAIAQLDEGGIDQATLHNANATMLNTLQANSPILVTQCGSWGDPGTAGSNWFSHLGPESIERVLAAPGGLSGAMENRYYWLGRNRANISKMAVMSQATGLDNSQLLPPYFPAFRGEDYLFASLIVCIHPDAAVLDYNWCIPHLPLEQRGGDSTTREPVAAQAGLALCARYLADRADFEPGASPATRLQKLAAGLRDLSERDPASLLATFRAELALQRADQLQQLSQQLQRAPALGSRDWEGYLQHAVDEVSGALQTPADVLDIPGVPAQLTEEELLMRVKTVMGEFAVALEGWPTIREAALNITNDMLSAGQLTP
ncbi:MAG: hypothetical protein DRR04_10185 [Gammaproteobacteria bacterium]|nr:MAG: hypothetical protein DRQ97_08395 [Gammaproteobacteria bacterium]RLA58759.1 MAG: hypothetical protein DRR04_10185 [Gammaproteobacteria bacterium]